MVNYNKPMESSKRGLYFMLAFALIIITFAQFASAQVETLGYAALNENYTFSQVCADATYITLSSIKTPTQIIYINENLTSSSSGEFSYNYTLLEMGRTDFRGVSDGCEKTFATYVKVNLSGVEPNMTLIIANIFLILLISGLIYLLHTKYKSIDYNDSDKTIGEEHNGNWGRTFIKTLGNNLMRNSFLWYYSLGWLLIIVLKDLVYTFSGEEIYRFFLLFSDIYSFGFFLIIVVWIGILIHHFRFITDLIGDLNLGVSR